LLPLKEKYPNHPDLITLLGMSHLSLGNHAVALQMLRHAYKLRPDIRSGLNLSSGLIADKQYARALNVTRKLMKRDEPYRFKERIYHNHAVALERSGRIKPAIIHYNKALEVNPIFYMSLMGLGKIHQSIQDLEKAQKFFIKANKSCQSCFEPVKQLAQLLINQGKRSTAQKLLQEYIDQPAVVQADQNSAQQLLKIASNAGRARDKRR
jgi:tetratricopeptide (TPR) repeat protein